MNKTYLHRNRKLINMSLRQDTQTEDYPYFPGIKLKNFVFKAETGHPVNFIQPRWLFENLPH